jgi:hypothetical protein
MVLYKMVSHGPTSAYTSGLLIIGLIGLLIKAMHSRTLPSCPLMLHFEVWDISVKKFPKLQVHVVDIYCNFSNSKTLVCSIPKLYCCIGQRR